ncbi:MAG: transglycosylase SLT domain-containing protein [Chloroflexota bacterium]
MALNQIHYELVDSPLTEYEEEWLSEEYNYQYSYWIESPEQIVLKRMMFILTFVVLFAGLVIFYGLPAILQTPLNTVSASANLSASASLSAGIAGAEEGAEAMVTGSQAERISPLFSREVQHWNDQIVAWAAQHDLDPNMVATVMQIESCGDPNAVSRAGAQGLFQVMPFHFAAGEDMQDPDTNAYRGMSYLVERLKQTKGEVGHAFAGYNGGHVAAGSGWDRWAHETQRYYVWSTGIYGEAQEGLTESPTLARWMEAGGASLCRQASQRLGLQ